MRALDQFDQVETIGFDYRQCHLVELDAGKNFFYAEARFPIVEEQAW